MNCSRPLPPVSFGFLLRGSPLWFLETGRQRPFPGQLSSTHLELGLGQPHRRTSWPQPRALGRHCSQRRGVKTEPLSPLLSLCTCVPSTWRFPASLIPFPGFPGSLVPLPKPCHEFPLPLGSLLPPSTSHSMCWGGPGPARQMRGRACM